MPFSIAAEAGADRSPETHVPAPSPQPPPAKCESNAANICPANFDLPPSLASMVVADTGLPVESIVDQLRGALATKGCAVVVAPPGTGKTTVLPLRLLAERWLGQKRILLLEPRRLAARAAARRMASLLGEPVGETVGFVTRHDRATSERTRIEVVTEGILTRRIQGDPSLGRFGLVMFDEVHERNLQTDLGLAFTLEARQALRPDLRIVAMSATIEPGRIAQALGGVPGPAPVVEAHATAHTVDIRWRGMTPAGSKRGKQRRSPRIEDHAASVVRQAVARDVGDILVFLPGIREIDAVAGRLADSPAEVHRLHGSLPVDVQDAALGPSPFPKIVLSTDISESSLTVEGVSVVVDSGLARAPRFDAATGMTRLRTIPISKASADQRAGRAGRHGPGVCYRLWSKMEHGTRKKDIEPEIMQVDLTGMLLEMAAWGVTDPTSLPFIDQPPQRTLTEALSLLVELGLLDPSGSITEAGRQAVGLPLHPRLARMIIGSRPGDGRLAALLAAILDERDPVVGPWDSLPVGVEPRVEALIGQTSVLELDRRRADRIKAVADELASRADLPDSIPRPDRSGRLLALAFPDRLAIRRGSPGRFQLRGGTTAWTPNNDPIAPESFLIAATLDGKRKDARIRMAAAIDRQDVLSVFADEVEMADSIEWSGRRLVARSRLSIGGITLDEGEHRAFPSERTHVMLLQRIASDGLELLPWNHEAIDLQLRSTYAQAFDPTWPQLGDEHLRSNLSSWLGPATMTMTSLDDLSSLNIARLFRIMLGPRSQLLDEIVPTRIELQNGRSATVDYQGESPLIRVRAQDLYGVTNTPTIGGRPVRVEVLSPANRPIQITSDLERFWTGSWLEIRKDMAARYPKHHWPERP